MPATQRVVKPARLPSASAAASRSAHKGRQTRAAIVEAALGLATQIGLEGLSIGVLAEVMQMSKSGVFSHFGSREELQLSVVRHYQARFEQEVFLPALKAPRGLPRLQALFELWMRRTCLEIDSGCLYISGAVEFDDRPGPVREALADCVRSWLAAMNRAVVQARQAGHLRPDADEQQIVFEIHGLILALHYEARFLKTPASFARAEAAFAGILARHGCAAVQTVQQAAQAAQPMQVTQAAQPTQSPQIVPHAVKTPEPDLPGAPSPAGTSASESAPARSFHPDNRLNP